MWDASLTDFLLTVVILSGSYEVQRWRGNTRGYLTYFQVTGRNVQSQLINTDCDSFKFHLCTVCRLK